MMNYAVIDSDMSSFTVKRTLDARLSSTDTTVFDYSSAQAVLTDLHSGRLTDVAGVFIDPRLRVTGGDIAHIDTGLASRLNKKYSNAELHFLNCGLYVMECLREHFPQSNIVCVSTYFAEKDHLVPDAKELCLESGADVYHEKPTSINLIIDDLLKTRI